MSDEPTDNVTPFPERNRKGQFTPGKSGNPNGRAKLTDPKDVLQAHARRVAQRLVELCTAPDTPPTARVSAIKEFHDRLYGKAPNNIVVKREETETEYDLAQLPDETLKQIVNLKGKSTTGDK